MSNVMHILHSDCKYLISTSH